MNLKIRNFGNRRIGSSYRHRRVLCLFSHGCGRKFCLRLCEEGTAGVPAGTRERWPGNPKDSIVATESLHPIADRRRRFLVRWSYEDYFPATEYASYDAFLNADGNPVKSEPRTRVVRLRRRVNGPQEAATRSFVSKPTIILCGRESGPAFASLRVSESSTVCVTLINRVCRPAETWDCFSTIFILP